MEDGLHLSFHAFLPGLYKGGSVLNVTRVWWKHFRLFVSIMSNNDPIFQLRLAMQIILYMFGV